MLGTSEQRCEAGTAVESGPTEPIDGSVSANQCGGRAIPDDRVILNCKSVRVSFCPAAEASELLIEVPLLKFAECARRDHAHPIGEFKEPRSLDPALWAHS